jgi:enediyne biosynthesis protein E3
MTIMHESASTCSPSFVPWVTSPVRRLLRLSRAEASFDTRGFAVVDPLRRLALEETGRAFIDGYNVALSTTRVVNIVEHVDGVSAANRGFAVEGAAMGAAIVDALQMRGHLLAALLEAFEQNFTYLIHVGAGWSFAYVPWRRYQIVRLLDPIHSWLAFDGLGFRDTYFHHTEILAGWRRRVSSYALHAYDQGVGRALWFAAGGTPTKATDLIRGFPVGRQSDLWSGLGLAMAYAGPVNAREIEDAFQRAGRHDFSFAQGIAFACEARVRASCVPSHTDVAARAVSGADAEFLAQLTRDARASLSGSFGDLPPYELWRQAVVAALSSAREGRQ